MKTFASDRSQAQLIIPWAKKACIRFHILAAMNACLHFGLSVEGTVNFLNLLNFLNFSDKFLEASLLQTAIPEVSAVGAQ